MMMQTTIHLVILTRMLTFSMSLTIIYYFEDSVFDILVKKFPNMSGDKVFSLCHMNIRSLKANLSSFQACLDNIKLQFSAIGISETWLNDWNSTLYNIQGYNFIEKHRSEKRGGGVGIYLKENISYINRDDLILPESEFESVFIEIDKNIFRKNKNLIIGVI